MKILFIGILLSALNFTDADALLSEEANYQACKSELEAMLPKARTGEEKAAVLWRLSRVTLLMGELRTDNDERRAIFTQGISYADKAIEASPKNPDCYMWHSANVGRECQTHSLMDQAKAVPVMMKDLEMILQTLGRDDYSAAWQALSEIYFNHPFKSTDDAVNFARRAAMTIPKGELRLTTYVSLARMLIKRDCGASKRASLIKSHSGKKYSGNIEKYAHCDALLGMDYQPMWSSNKLSQMSDAEEAKAILTYASKLYANAKEKGSMERKSYAELQKILKEL